MFTVTPAAAEQIRRSAEPQPEQDGKPMLRVAAKIGDDGEILYGMGFDEQREHDAVVESGGIVVLIAPPSQELLDGTTLDFVELNPGEFQFIFLNPHAGEPPSSCGSAGRGCGGCGGGCG